MSMPLVEDNKAAPAIPRLVIETRSIDHVPVHERHGTVLKQAPFWFLGNFSFFTVSVGFIGPGMGLSFFHTCIASVLGILFGTLFMAFHASQGPELGLPQMIQSRAQFGYRGVIIPLASSILMFVGFNVVDTVLISEGLNHLLHFDVTIVSFAISIGAAIIAIYGHDWLHFVFSLLFWISVPIYLVLSGAILSGALQPQALAPAEGLPWLAFAAQFAACASYNITSAPYVSDYTRYLPRDTNRPALVCSVYLAASLSALWLIIIGAWLSSRLAATDGLVALNDAGNRIFPFLGTVNVLVSIAALVAAMALNAYSGMLTIVTAIDTLAPLRVSRTIRIACILAVTAIWLAIALSLTPDAVATLSNFLSLMLYLLIPWTAINLTDYFFIRKGRYAIEAFFTPSGIYGAWNWRGLFSYFIGLAASAPFLNLTGIFEGPLAKALGDIDVSWAPGLLTAAIAYVLLMRNADLSHERAAIDGSSL